MLGNIIGWQEAKQVQATLWFIGKVCLIVSRDWHILLAVLCRKHRHDQSKYA